MPGLDNERKEFNQIEQQADPINKRIDEEYLVLLTFLVAELRTSNFDEKKVSSDAQAYLSGMTDDLLDYIYMSIEGSVVNGMAEVVYAKSKVWTIEEARDYVNGTLPDNLPNGSMPRPNYEQSTKAALKEMAEKRLEGRITPGTAKDVIIKNGLQREQTRAFFEDTYNDLLLATGNTDERIKKVIREISSDVLQRESLLSRNNTALAKALDQRLSSDAILKRLTQDGLVGIVDRGGKRWRLDAYSKMVVNTKITEAHLQATKLLGRQLGMDLAVISDHGATDACSGWEGVVVSLYGETPGYPRLDDAIETNEVFHPNCRHHISVINSLDDLSDYEKETHLNKVGAVAEPELRPYRRQN